MDIDVYIDSEFEGFRTLSYVEKLRRKYYGMAAEMAHEIEWDEVILYAIYSYNEKDQAFISADFMCLRMSFAQYKSLCEKISRTCRLFCLKNR
ncbi:MAG: hypothetical protein BWZ04_01723 [Firmicutes bacterium ADurb.BinA205]|nr:MAG: hypothetical protein BWZ04_01723 [Firmicutes bacterium ADurb.BinA205]